MMSNSGEKTPDKTNEPAKSVAKPAAKPAAKAKTVKAKAAAKNPPDTATAVKKAADKTTTAESAAPTKSAVAKSTASKNTVAKSTAAKNTGVKTTAAQAATAKAPVAKTTGAKTSVAESTVVKTAQIKAQTGGVKGDMVPAQPTNATPTPEKMTTPASVNTTPQRNSRETEPAVSNVLTPSADGEAQKPAARHPVARREASDGRLAVYAQLMRLNRPIGILLLLWPTLWSLWLAAGGFPRWDLLVIFTLGVVLMRSAGCVINDYADRKIDGHVARTKTRPLATGSVSSREALTLFAVLCLLAFGLVLLTNTLTIQLSLGGLLLAFCYPFMKRHTHLPQVVLGAAFAWSIPMAFAARRGALAQEMWLIYLAVVLWTVVYDTFYAMVDRDDDKRIGVKSTAILFGEQDRFITGFLQVLTLYALVLVGGRFELGNIYYASLVVAAGLFAYQQYLIRFRDRDRCFKAFLNNHWVGMVIFIGIVADLALKTPS